MRTITDHKLPGLNDRLTITARDEPSAIGANHRYLIELFQNDEPAERWPDGVRVPRFQTVIGFQNGPIGDGGFQDMNGISNEALLAVVIDRLRGFQGENPKPEGFGAVAGDATAQVKAMGVQDQWGRFRCRENAVALTHLETALMFLQKRTRDRLARGVEGSHKV